MAFVVYQSKRKRTEAKNRVSFSVKLVGNFYRAKFQITEDVVESIIGKATIRVKILYDDKNNRKVFICAAKKEEPNSFSFRLPKKFKYRALVLSWDGYMPISTDTQCEFEKFELDNMKGILITLPQ